MAQYRVLKKSYLHNKIYEPGEIVEWDGPQGTNLEPIGNEKRPPEPSRITGMPGPDPGSPPPQTEGKSEFDRGGPTRQDALEEYDKKRLADQEADVLPNEPLVLAEIDEAEGKQKTDAEDPEIQARNQAVTGPLPGELPVETKATEEGPRKSRKKESPGE